ETVNHDYANTSLGYRNSGALSAGRLMLWDVQENDLITLAADVPVATLSPTPPVRLEATSIRGASFTASADIPETTSARISSEVRNNLSFSISDAVRINAAETYSAISRSYTTLISSGVNAFTAWRIADVTGMPDRYKFVLVTDEIRASDETVSLDSTFASGVEFAIEDTASGTVQVSIPSTTTAKCSGEEVICYVNVSVLTVFINDTGNLDYSPSGFDAIKLVNALRSLS
ncbi:MAG: hypothetical protein AAFO57_04270, partial [Pseudomonadota bacterium]